jgi:hypothetical protein
MADETETTTTAAEDKDPVEPEGHAGLTLDGLADKVDALADKVTAALTGRPRAAGSTTAAEADEVAGQVRSELTKIKADDDRRQKTSDRIGQIEAKVKEITEKQPVEYRPITRWMWGDPE